MGDFDGDGDLDVAVNRVWFANPGRLDAGPEAPWLAHSYRGGRHDITAASLDGHLDVFAGEREDPDTDMVADGLRPMKPEGLQERGVVWENAGTPAEPRFVPKVVHQGRPGCHDTVLVDFDGEATSTWSRRSGTRAAARITSTCGATTTGAAAGCPRGRLDERVLPTRGALADERARLTPERRRTHTSRRSAPEG